MEQSVSGNNEDRNISQISNPNLKDQLLLTAPPILAEVILCDSYWDIGIPCIHQLGIEMEIRQSLILNECLPMNILLSSCVWYSHRINSIIPVILVVI